MNRDVERTQPGSSGDVSSDAPANTRRKQKQANIALSLSLSWLEPLSATTAVDYGSPQRGPRYGGPPPKVCNCVGGVLSPLLANIYLHPLDKYWSEKHRETKLVRYCDDFVVLIRRRRPDRYFQSLQEFLKRLHLSLSSEKTAILNAEEGFDFLGVHLHLKPTRRDRNRKFCYGFPTAKSMKRVRSSVREQLGRDYSKSLNHMIKYINPILRGWGTYYSWLNSAEHFHEIDRYMIQKLNRWNRRKRGSVGRSYRKLPGKALYGLGLYKLTGRVVHVT